MLSLWLSLAFAGPSAVVAVGDGLVVGAIPEGATSASAGGWVAGLGDCLNEGAPGRFSVVDRVRSGETAVSATEVVDATRSMKPQLVVIGVGAQEAVAGADVDAFSAQLRGLIDGLKDSGRRKPNLLVVGVVPPVVGDAQQAVDDNAARWNTAIASTAESAGVRHVDLWSDWPRAAAERAPLTADGWRLTDQGHARVAAAVCDAVLSWKDGSEETP
ncbi:MAG: SGNH/GDSL hydrolase family protein [Proteobacteria bacterium]|nr:SGNH/GDSL hydrolase family protein [Pseudomonadota bacterium]